MGGDADELVENILGTAYGDSNLDGMVSFADFLNLQSNFGGAGGWAMGDFSGDANVSFADFLALQTNFGFNSMVAPLADPASISAVPEPSSVILFGLGLTGLVCRVYRGRKSTKRQSVS